MISQVDLPSEVLDIGLLLGLLTESGGEYSPNLAWFEDPLAPSGPSLATIGERLDSLVALIEALLGPGQPDPPQVFPGAQWYALPDPNSGAATPFCLVAPAPATGSGQLGFGALYALQTGNLSIDLFLYVPLVSFSPAGTEFIAGRASDPCAIGLNVGTVDQKGFQSGAASFAALDVAVKLYLDPDAYTAQPAPAFFQITFEQLGGSDLPNSYTTLAALSNVDVESWIGTVLLQGSGWLGTSIGESPITIGNILVAGDIVTVDANGNYSLDLGGLDGLSPLQIALKFVFGALNALADGDTPFAIIPLPGGGLYAVRRANADGSSDYGVRLAAEIELSLGQTRVGSAPQSSPAAAPTLGSAVRPTLNDAPGDPPAAGPSPTIDVCLGTWLSGEDDTSSWIVRSAGASAGASLQPGLSIFALHCDKNLQVGFAPGFVLASVGLDIQGANNGALIDLNGFTLQGAELRAYLNSAGWAFGMAARLDGLGFPLGPSFGQAVQGSSSNPVAQSLLESGSGGGDQDPVNPAFSASAAYVRGGTFAVQLYDQNGAPATQVMIPIQRALGPLQCQSLGIGWVQQSGRPSDDMLSLLFSGSISLAGLSVDLVGLSLGMPVTGPTDFSRYDLDLDGLGVLLSAGEVELSAALVKVPPDPAATPPRSYTQYDGEALLQAGTFAIAAVGSYAYVPGASGQPGYASLFIFGMLDADLGGPAFFYVTGLAAGFGYNRALILPDQNSVTTYPLVAAASDPAQLGAQKQASGGWKMPDPATALALLDQYAPPQRGEYWLAAGVRFTSFDLINSTALLVVAFGHELEIALLGLSWFSLPPPVAPGASAPSLQYAYAELGMEVKLLPSEGLFSATAILTSNSFVIDPACKLTGGFAFYVWFGDNPHAGEFVLTLGGYHPDFTPPSYYPTVPRLGFSWPMPGNVTISGDAYFALTASAVMAGAGLQVLYSQGSLRAWFTAQMDALVEWAPFHYLVAIDISLGASYRAHLVFVTVTLKVELGASLTLWGPKMGGKVHITWYVISFTVSFGASPATAPLPLDWANDDGTGFAQTLLPHTAPAAPSALAASGAAQPAGIYTITANSGLLSTFADANGNSIWIVRPATFSFSALTAIPATEIDIVPAADEPAGTPTIFSAQAVAPDGASYSVCIRPMKTTLSTSVLSIRLSESGGAAYDLAGAFDFELALSKVPAAKWGQPLGPGQCPEMNSLLSERLLGLANIQPKLPGLTPAGADALAFDMSSAFGYDVVDAQAPYSPNWLPLQSAAAPAGVVPQAGDQSIATIQATLMDETVVATRNAIFAALQLYGVGPATNGGLSTLAADPGAYLVGAPLIAVAAGS